MRSIVAEPVGVLNKQDQKVDISDVAGRIGLVQRRTSQMIIGISVMQ